ncbi:MAG: TonB-dependent receptor, partial [Rhodocyclaceae bacterium]|nr:TonB-dependent receptor [Rhodocyclaceae bacterium]
MKFFNFVLSRQRAALLLTAASAALAAGPALSGGIPTLREVEIHAGQDGFPGSADSASEGTVTKEQLATRPLLRPGEVLEIVPGLIISQHSGDGKANQYYLRGFNLDHGTDCATWVMGMPANMPTHAHGQGYTDLNFLMPELIERIQYRKGPYRADQGDFSATGSVSIEYARVLPSAFAELGLGQNGYRRGLVAGSPRAGPGNLLYGLEWQEANGPWVLPENYGKLNGVLRWSWGTEENGGAVTALGYRARWSATDQVPQRAIDAGTISRFGTVDPTDGGRTSRYSLSGEWARGDAATRSRASAYAIRSAVDLWSNFTFFMDNPALGDQFLQSERRSVLGGQVAHTRFTRFVGRPAEFTIGAQVRRDRLDPVALRLDSARQTHRTVREDRVTQTGIGLYAEGLVYWTDWLRSIAGLRADHYSFDIASSLPANSGRASDRLASPKLTVVLGPWAKTELFLNHGYGFHSNDARGATTRVNPDPRDPGFLAAVDPVKPLVKARAMELGLRTAAVPGLVSSLALWRLDIDSELLFVGDAGTTEPSRPSRRQGVEWANWWTPLAGLTVDADLAASRARFRDVDPAGDRIPGAIERTVSVGVAWDDKGRWFGGLRLR